MTRKLTPQPIRKSAEEEERVMAAYAFDAGRQARRHDTPRDQVPTGKADHLIPKWHEGWDYEDGLRGT